MLPNFLSDEEGAPTYNSVDAALWYFVAVWAYLRARPDDLTLLRDLYPTLNEILAWYFKGTRHQIEVDPTDGLLYAGEEGVQLTWMDVKIGHRALTPRTGKAVEVNALWINALFMMSLFAEKLGQQADQERFKTHAQRASDNFNRRFWSPARGFLYDVIDTPQPERRYDDTLRPNQLLALSLPFRVLQNNERAQQVLEVCARELLVSHGLRTLGRDEPGYIGKFGGVTEKRDQAYHQGTAWAWLLGAFVSAHYAVYRDAKVALSFLEPMADLLHDHGMGTLSEVFDGDAPFSPNGAVAEAWSVAEVLRVWHELSGLAR
jgi:predicted glycogen debranching enzyme